MNRWGTSYLGPEKLLRSLSSHEESRHEYYAQPQEMAAYRDRFEDEGPSHREKVPSKNKDGVVRLWVFRVVHLTDITLESFIRRQGINVLQIQEVSQREAAYKSFVITVHTKDAPTLLHKTFWPGLVSCKYWHEQGEVSKGAALSRRTSARGNRKASARGGRTPPQILPPLQTNASKSKESTKYQQKSNTKEKSQTRKNNSSTQKRQKTTVTASKVPRKGDDTSRSKKHQDVNVSHNTHKNKNSFKNGDKNSIGDKSKVTEKDRERVKREFEDKFNAWSEKKEKERKQATAKNHTKAKYHNDKGKRTGTSKEIKVRDTAKQKNGKGSGSLTKRQDDTYPSLNPIQRSKGRQGTTAGKSLTNPTNKTRKRNPESSGNWSDNEEDERLIGKKDRSPRHRRLGGTPYGKGYLYSHETEKDSNRETYLLPEIPAKTPTPRSQEMAVGRTTRYTSALPSIGVSGKQQKANASQKQKLYPNWVMPLSGLLIQSSEEVVFAMLGTQFDGLLTQDVISDDELFLGVKVLAHAARAKTSEENIMTLVYKIWQPHVIQLIKTFTVTVERLYPKRAERYFWDLAEFLDLYVSRNITIEHMATLINTCLMEVLALNYKSFLADDIVKVYQEMQKRVQRRSRP